MRLVQVGIDMEELTISINADVLIKLAMSQGWQAEIDGQPNPVTYQQFTKVLIETHTSELVMSQGRQMAIAGFANLYNLAEEQINNRIYDDLIAQGDIEGIKAAVVASAEAGATAEPAEEDES